MKLIEPKVELYPQEDYTLEGIYKQIEKCARLSYKSENKITDTSSKKFVDNLIKAGHGAALEHGTVYLKWHAPGIYDRVKGHTVYDYVNNPYSKSAECLTEKSLLQGTVEYRITTNYRVLIEKGWLDDLKYLCEPTEFHEKRYSVKFTTDIGTAREFTRHRAFSLVQESTRYVSSCERKNISKYDCNSLTGIIEAYNNGFSMKEISQNSSISESTVRRHLLKNNVQLRGLHNTGLRDNHYFTVIDSPEKAYLLGLIQTDGSIRNEPSKTVSITQHKDYAWYIEALLHNISEKICITKDDNCKQLSIGSKEIVNDLISLGIVPNKTKNQSDKDIDTLWNSIPKEYINDFIRGLIDGDGHVSFFVQKRAKNESCNIGLCSTQEHLIDKVIEYIKNTFNYACGKGKDGSIHKLWITNYKKAIEVGEQLYKNFKYPFGHPKKASSWIQRIKNHYSVAEFADPNFFISKPYWLEDSPQRIFEFIKLCYFSEKAYTSLRLSGAKPQEARQVLPLATKTELVMTGFESDWRHFFDLRLRGTTGAPHPDAKRAAQMAWDLLKETYNVEL